VISHKGRGRRNTKGIQRHTKGSEDNARKMDKPKEKKSILYWIYAKEHYAKNFPLKKILNALEKVENPYVGVL